MVNRSVVTRTVLSAIAVVGLFAGTSQPAQAQGATGPQRSWELVAPAGRFIPTGAQRDVLERGGVNAVQLAYVRQPSLAFTTTLGWARSRDVVAAGNPKLNVYLFDVGTEVRAPRWLSRNSWSFSPFAGVGAGARAYDHRGSVATTQHVAAYGSAGAEFGYRRVRLRLEARDYLTGLETRRNDVVTMIGLRIASRG